MASGTSAALLHDFRGFAAMRHKDAGLKALGKAFTTEPIGIALPPGDAQLTNLLENYLRALERQGALARARDVWFENDDWLDSLR